MNLDLEPIIKVFLIILALATVVGIVGICFGIAAIATAVKAYFAGKTAKAKLNPSATFALADRAPPPLTLQMGGEKQPDFSRSVMLYFLHED